MCGPTLITWTVPMVSALPLFPERVLWSSIVTGLRLWLLHLRMMAAVLAKPVGYYR